ncbi:quinoprotein glucose dehydrogenase/quinate dehydrogenase (quinone) [Sphingobium xenophagum]|uniref:Quinoprotein glucose dehydrogenase/quinate dehydrogenase (Quinone) n=1 Tax=Sphingobium xenophagum TaxID=121428 RepID=A0ABU1WYP4_SPHXE|nr:membrane-bound PQQ-dependent dehydrogenase, glucose/quinate/shikimate family [Sphingobium xenophagum]MDR7154036.1 quinoprotein glucose dehydrogenase/quinate dehydrogenase (quinone) [Sphingobium xenophagum]
MIWPVRLVAALLLIIGLIVAAGGAHLIWLGGSPYYLPGGSAVALSGYWLWRGDRRSGWLYALFLAVTIVWALCEVGLDGWQLTARIVGPALFALAFLLSFIRRRVGKGAIAAGLVGFASFLLILGCALQSPMEIAALSGRTNTPIAIPGDPGQWPAWGRDTAGTRFSPLTQITPANVRKLQLAWTFDTGHDPMSAPVPSPLQSTPLMVDGKLLLCTQTNIVFALDPETGKQLWRFDPRVDPKGGSAVRTCRGVAYHDGGAAAPAPCPRRVITATYCAQLIALDSATGRPCPGFGQRGFVDLNQGMGRTAPGLYYVSSAPVIIGDVIVLGGWVADNVSTDEPSGVVRGYDVITGALRWAWDMGNPNNMHGPPPGDTYTRSTPNSWAPMSADAKLGLVFVPTGNATPDHFGTYRSAQSEKYSSSVVALDVATGAVRWSFQTAHHDLWDYDVASQPTLIDLPASGGTIPALVQPTKRGELFLLDRRSGKPLAEVRELPAPQAGKVPEERLSPTQPFSVGMPSLAGRRISERDMWGITPIDQLWCRIHFRKLRYDGPNTPPGLTESLLYPSLGGGMNWGGVSYDPERRLLMVNSIYYPTLMQLVPRAAARGGKGPRASHNATDFAAPLPMAGTPYAARLRGFTSPLGTLCLAPPYGRMTAIDMTTRKIAWQRPVGTVRDSGPLGLEVGLPVRMGMPGFGGTLVTRSGLIFFGGVKERAFRAFATDTGKELWSVRMPASGNANPMTYVGPRTGRQFVVIAATGHVTSQSFPLGRTFHAYALPQEAK